MAIPSRWRGTTEPGMLQLWFGRVSSLDQEADVRHVQRAIARNGCPTPGSLLGLGKARN